MIKLLSKGGHGQDMSRKIRVADIIKEISSRTYEEEAIEIAITKLVERGASELRELIKKNERFQKDQIRAIEIIKILEGKVEAHLPRGGGVQYTGKDGKEIWDDEEVKALIVELHKILDDEEKITEALRALSKDLARIMKEVRKKE